MTQPNHGSADDASAKSDAIPVLSYESRHHNRPATWSLASVSLILLGLVWALLASLAAVWAIVCALGGPDARIGSWETIVGAAVCLGLYALLGDTSASCFREVARRRGDSPPKVWVVLLYEALAGLGLMAAVFVVSIFLR